MKSVQVVVALGLFVAGTIASDQHAMNLHLATCTECSSTYQDCLGIDQSNWVMCYNTYSSCVLRC